MSHYVRGFFLKIATFSAEEFRHPRISPAAWILLQAAGYLSVFIVLSTVYQRSVIEAVKRDDPNELTRVRANGLAPGHHYAVRSVTVTRAEVQPDRSASGSTRRYVADD